MSTTQQQQERIHNEVATLRATADFLESRAEVIAALSYSTMRDKFPNDDHDNIPYVGMWVMADKIEFTVYGPHMRDTMRTFRKSLDIPGEWEKGGYGSRFNIRTTINGTAIVIEGDREQVCQRVVVGTEPVTIPEQEYRPERVEQREKVEWVCGNLLQD